MYGLGDQRLGAVPDPKLPASALDFAATRQGDAAHKECRVGLQRWIKRRAQDFAPGNARRPSARLGALAAKTANLQNRLVGLKLAAPDKSPHGTTDFVVIHVRGVAAFLAYKKDAIVIAAGMRIDEISV